MNGGVLDESNAVKFITENAVEHSATKIVPAGSIMVGVRVGVGKVAVNSVPMCTSQDIVSIIGVDEQLWNKEYISYAIQYKAPRLAAQAQGATITGITSKALKAVTIPVREKSSQDQIVWTLNYLKELLLLSEQRLAKLDDLVKSRFVEMFGTAQDPKYAVVPVENVCSAIVDCPHETPKYEGCLVHPAIRTSELTGTGISWETMKYVSDEEYLRRIRRIKPLPGDVVYAREGTYGNAAVLPEGHDFCLGQRTMLFRPKAELCLSNYLLHALTSVDVKRQADELNVGSTVPHVNVRDAKRFAIPMPPIREQQEFADFVAQVDKLRVEAQAQKEKLQTLYDSLAQDYFAI